MTGDTRDPGRVRLCAARRSFLDPITPPIPPRSSRSWRIAAALILFAILGLILWMTWLFIGYA